MDQQLVDARTSPAEAMAMAQKAMAAVESGESVEAPPIPSVGPNPIVRLPGGLNHLEYGHIDSAEVRELTGADEEHLARLGDTAHFKTALLERGVVSLGDAPATKELLNELLVGDREALLLAIRIATFGPELTIPVAYPDGSVHEVTVDLSEVESATLDDLGPYEVSLPSGRFATVELVTGVEEVKAEALLAKGGTQAEVNSYVLGQCVTELGDEVWLGEKSARDLSLRDRRFLIDYLSKGQPGPRLGQFTIRPEGYDVDVPAPISLTDLFRA
jgi:hypothetical protein